MVLGIKYRLLVSHLAIALIASVAASIYLFVSFGKLQVGYHEHALLASAYALADVLDVNFGTPRGLVQVDRSMRKLARDDSEKFAILDVQGKVLSSSVPVIPSKRSLHREIREALKGKEFLSVKNAVNDNDERIIVAVPIERDGEILGVVRAWILEKDYQASLSPIKRITGLVMTGIAVLCVVLSLLLAQALITPIRQMRQLSRRIAKGDFSIRLTPSGKDELGQLSDDLNVMATRLQDLDNARRDSMGNVSHELRSPVSNIRITSEVLERRAEKLGDDSAKLFQTVVHETERLESLINELMELSAIDSGALILEREVFHLRPLLQELIDNVCPRVELKNLTLGLLADPDLEIVADKLRLGRAIANLIDNAIKFTPDNGQIVISARQEPAETVIEVIDNGEGIAPEDLPRVFERFFRADKARQRKGGSGIGLSIVKRIAEAHGGKAHVRSELGTGSTFSISIPTSQS